MLHTYRMNSLSGTPMKDAYQRLRMRQLTIPRTIRLPDNGSMTQSLDSYEIDDNLIISGNVTMPCLHKINGNLRIESGTLVAPNLKYVNGYYQEHKVGVFDYSKVEFEAGEIIACHEYALHYKKWAYTAGCHGPWGVQEALEHWQKRIYCYPKKEDAQSKSLVSLCNNVRIRAKLFIEAIYNHASAEMTMR